MAFHKCILLTRKVIRNQSLKEKEVSMADFAWRFAVSKVNFHNTRSMMNPRESVHIKLNWSEITSKVKQLIQGPSLSENLDAVFRLLTRQCSVYTWQRVRRLNQIIFLYKSIYSDKALQHLALNFARHLRGNKKQWFSLFSAVCFAWEHEQITDSEIERILQYDLQVMKELTSRGSAQTNIQAQLSDWENVLNEDHLKIWRRPYDSTYLYEYKVYGRFLDISARSFMKVQLDVEYRKTWDKLVIKLDVVDRDEETGSEVIHWITYFPFPMQSRDYVYTRRHKTDHRNKVLYLVSKASEHPRIPVSGQYVRVNNFQSHMVIKPHRSFDENGLDYILTYHDDPKAPFSSLAVKWMTCEGIPRFVEDMHKAAKQLEEFLSSGELKDYGESNGKHSQQHVTSWNE